jgi:FkbM family methyltransferase
VRHLEFLTWWRRRRREESAGITEEDVRYAYRIILKREPDPPGLAHYVALGAGGFPFDRLVSSLFESEEYRFRLAESWRPTPVDLGGYQVCVQRRDRDFAEAMLDTREYEPHVRQAVSRLLEPGDVVVDVGANVGVMTFLAASKVGPAGLVVAVEPNPDNVQMLYAGIVVNGCSNVRVLPWAASNRSAVLSLTGGVSNTWVTAARPPGEGFYTQAVRLDDALADLTRLDLLKLDIEGHEPEAFEGARGLVERFRPALVAEFNPRCLADIQGGDPAAFLSQLFAFYPRLRATSGHGDDRMFERVDDVLSYWAARNEELTARGVLADRHLHFDLVAEGGLQSGTPARS